MPSSASWCWAIAFCQSTLSYGRAQEAAPDRRLILDPALPGAWPAGRVTGLRARGGVEVDVAWESGKLTEATLRSRSTVTSVRWDGCSTR